MNNETFLNLSPKQSKGLDKSIFKNAKHLNTNAKLLAQTNKSYNIASSLLILSTEETIKAILVLLHSNNYKVYNFKGAKKLFTQHTIRHDIAKFLELLSGLVKSAEKYEETDKNLINSKYKWLNDIVNGSYIFLNTIAPILNSIVNYSEIEQFNNYKNKGFYADYNNRILMPKEELKEDKYQSILEINQTIFRNYKILSIIFHSEVNRHQNVDEIKEGLKDIVSTVLNLAVNKKIV